jgi:phosphoribosylaminoimidazolecarboxamide formyltransferase/IMP cyclohydrolase
MKPLNKINAFISVSDKNSLIDFISQLKNKFEINIVSTGGTRKHLEQGGFKVTPVEKVIDFPAILNGRVKSLHPKIFGGILADPEDKKHKKDLKKHNIRPFDLVVINFYPFKKTVQQEKDLNEVIENIDIGGPSAIRAAAKNFQSVIPVCDPNDYQLIAQQLNEQENLNFDQRKNLAVKAFQLTKDYDQAIINYFQNH